MGKDDSKWSWGQGTGINAGVMLWQPDLDVLSEMLSELSEKSHPEHCAGNGPEQDYLSRFWADAPWTHIGVGYNYQVHQMFLALHPDHSDSVERKAILRSPEQIKVVHFSGDDSAKPWCRVLDKKWEAHWPIKDNRSRDAEYAAAFAEEFQGYFLWIKHDQEWLESSQVMSNQRWRLQDIYIGEDGKMYRRAPEEGEEPTCVEMSEETRSSVMNFLDGSLRRWFDAFQELEAELDVDLRQSLTEAAAAAAAHASAPSATQPESPASNGCAHAPSSTNGASASWATAECERAAPGEPRSAASEPRKVPQFKWDRRPDGWWAEIAREGWGATPATGSADDTTRERFARLVATCGSSSAGRFVTFLEGGSETCGERGVDLSGMFVKVAGGALRHFLKPADIVNLDGAEDIAAIRRWVDTVPEGASVLLAVVGVDPAVLTPALQALAPLGVPSNLTPQDCASFAGVGKKPHGAGCIGGESYNGRWGDTKSNKTWLATHASTDVAYAAMPVWADELRG
eukprot:gnl/TRDRNA2_/TRDRNA2_199394_c0_seq1.p1 gnl/TRDRNA2_/TRDRNA2_199394_c0~~gnl/TRDRNA2_/TRDRNA2_199394_c0_seq1.p1  ORF type:complete len:598 (-),score=110.48 gnl/TRDRNA2_/TRDRNA2_199394_c0_seq1:57-1595(-)